VAEKSVREALCGFHMGMMEATREGDGGSARDTGHPLRQALIRTIVVEVPDVFAQD
jgi:hypothetical protein